jgi:hypothetical protein
MFATVGIWIWALAAMFLAAAAPLPTEITVSNHAAFGIVEIYVSSAEDDSWGENRLTGPIVAPGQSYRVTPLRAQSCRVDLRVIYENGTLEDKRGLDACRLRQLSFDATTAVVPQPPSQIPTQQSITVVNHSPRSIVELYVSSAGSDEWGDDLIATGPIKPGGSEDKKPKVSCMADIRVVFENRSAEERRDLNLCVHAKIDIKPGWTTSEERSNVDRRESPCLSEAAICGRQSTTDTCYALIIFREACSATL